MWSVKVIDCLSSTNSCGADVMIKAHGARRESHVPDWEYLYVKMSYGGYTAYTREGKRRLPVEWSHQPDALPLKDYFAQLREDGWRLFEDSPRHMIFMFRRPRTLPEDGI